MRSHPLVHFQLPHPRIDLRRLGRVAIIATELGLAATVVAASERTLRTTVGSSEAAVHEAAITVNVPLGVEVHVGTVGVAVIVHGIDSSAVNTVSLMDEHGDPIVNRLTTETGFRFEDVPAGRYRVVVSSDGPIVHVDGAAISSAVAVRSEPFALLTPGLVTIESR